VLSPLHEGLTKIDQLPGLVMIRNQFGKTRSLTIEGAGRRGVERAMWDGGTLVLKTDQHHGFVFLNAPGPTSGSQVIERFTRLDADTLVYTYLHSGSGAGGEWTIAFPLIRSAIRRSSGLRESPPGPCEPGTRWPDSGRSSQHTQEEIP
jgi:hypothetical protein